MKNFFFCIILLLPLTVFGMAQSILDLALFHHGTDTFLPECGEKELAVSYALYTDDAGFFRQLPDDDATNSYLNDLRSDDMFSIFELAVKWRRYNVFEHFVTSRPFLNSLGIDEKWFEHDKNNVHRTVLKNIPRYSLLKVKDNRHLTTMRDRFGRNLLHWSIDNDFTRLTNSLIANHIKLIDENDDNGWNAVHWAIARGNFSVLQKLENKLSLDAFNNYLNRDFNGASISHWFLMGMAARIIPFDDPHIQFFEKLLPLIKNPSIDSGGETVQTLFSWLTSNSYLRFSRSYPYNVLFLAIRYQDVLGARRFARYFPSLLLERTSVSLGNDGEIIDLGLTAPKPGTFYFFKTGLTPLELASEHPFRAEFSKGFIEPIKAMMKESAELVDKGPIQSLYLMDINWDDPLILNSLDAFAKAFEKHNESSPMDIDPEATSSQTKSTVASSLFEVETIERLPVEKAKAPITSRKISHMANSFMQREYRVLPTPHERHARSFDIWPQISFHKIEATQSFAVLEREISTHKMRGKYFSLHENFPNGDERVTIVLAGRKTAAYIPEENEGGRVILILAGKFDEELAKTLVSDHVDAFVISSLSYFHGNLDDAELSLVTSRRLAAFELMTAMPERKTFAVLDDNIENIIVNEKIWTEEKLNKNWSSFYDLMAKKTESFSCIGFKEERPHINAHVKPDDNLTIIDQGHSGRDFGFGQKIFFFNWHALRHASREKMKNFFPPKISLTQEDLLMQIFLAKSGTFVGHVSRYSMYFERVKGKSIAKKAAQKNPKKSEEWLNINTDSEKHHVRKNTIEEIKKYVDENLRNAKNKRRRQEERPLTDYFEKQTRFLDPNKKPQEQETGDITDFELRALAEDIEASMQPQASANKALPSTKKRKRSITETNEHFTYRFGELDHKRQTFTFFAASLQKKPKISSSLRPFQNAALQSIGFDVARGSRLGFIKMPTGTGKTRVFIELVKRAKNSIDGNIALVLPNLDIQQQVFEQLKVFIAELKSRKNAEYDLKHLDKIILVSSLPQDAHAELTALNKPLKNGGHILLFCEKSFPTFVEHRRGNLSDFSLLIFDEMHKIKDNTAAHLGKLLENHQGLVLGFSATPRKRENTFGGKKGRMYCYRTKTAVQEGYLAPWTTKLLPPPANANHFADYLADNLLKQESDGKKLATLSGIVYTGHLTKDIEDIATTLRKRGIAAEAYHSKLENRQVVLQRFKQGTTKVLVAIRTLREGFDASVDYVFINQPHLLKEDIKQMRGRALRKTRPNKIALILTTNEETRRMAMWSKPEKITRRFSRR